jgi:hypothetical protein
MTTIGEYDGIGGDTYCDKEGSAALITMNTSGISSPYISLSNLAIYVEDCAYATDYS